MHSMIKKADKHERRKNVGDAVNCLVYYELDDDISTSRSKRSRCTHTAANTSAQGLMGRSWALGSGDFKGLDLLRQSPRGRGGVQSVQNVHRAISYAIRAKQIARSAIALDLVRSGSWAQM